MATGKHTLPNKGQCWKLNFQLKWPKHAENEITNLTGWKKAISNPESFTKNPLKIKTLAETGGWLAVKYEITRALGAQRTKALRSKERIESGASEGASWRTGRFWVFSVTVTAWNGPESTRRPERHNAGGANIWAGTVGEDIITTSCAEMPSQSENSANTLWQGADHGHGNSHERWYLY